MNDKITNQNKYAKVDQAAEKNLLYFNKRIPLSKIRIQST